MSGHEALQRDGEGTRGPFERARAAPTARARAALPLAVVAEGLAARWVSVRPADVVFVKGLVEASEGLAGVFAERGGELLLAAPWEREAELCELLADLEEELYACVRSATMGEAPQPASPTGVADVAAAVVGHETTGGQGP